MFSQHNQADNLSAIQYPHHAEIDVERHHYSFHDMMQLAKIPLLKVIVLILAFSASRMLSNMCQLALETLFSNAISLHAMEVILALFLVFVIALILAYVESTERSTYSQTYDPLALEET